MSYFTLLNGVKIPSIGFGTYRIPDGNSTFDSVSFALKNGYRLIDTAHAYGNERSVGRAVQNSGIERQKIFVTSKLPAEIKTYKGTLQSFNNTMKEIELDYIDLYLIHAPWPWLRMGSDYTKENISVWKAMEAIYKSGRCSAIGVSNFNIHDLTPILDNCKIQPMVNQIKCHIGYTQDEIVHFCSKSNIIVEGYSPLATGAILKNEGVAEIAAKYNKSVSQMCIRFLLQKGIIPLPKSIHNSYIIENSDVDFEISELDMVLLNSIKDQVGSANEKTIFSMLVNSIKSTVMNLLGTENYLELKKKIRAVKIPKMR